MLVIYLAILVDLENHLFQGFLVGLLRPQLLLSLVSPQALVVQIYREFHVHQHFQEGRGCLFVQVVHRFLYLLFVLPDQAAPVIQEILGFLVVLFHLDFPSLLENQLHPVILDYPVVPITKFFTLNMYFSTLKILLPVVLDPRAFLVNHLIPVLPLILVLHVLLSHRLNLSDLLDPVPQQDHEVQYCLVRP